MDMLVKSESLTSVADAIRTKGETTEQLVFPDGFAAAIMAIESGGVKPQLIVTAPAGSTITAVNGEDTVTGVIGTEGTLTLDLPAFGTWEVTATLDENEASTSVYIEQEYPVELGYITAFTVNGGYGETVTISDGDTTVESVTLESDGTGKVSVSNVKNKTLTFTGGLSGHTVDVEVGQAAEMTVNVYPDGALFWYGRTFESITGGWERKAYGGTTSGSFALYDDRIEVNSPNITKTVCVGLINFDPASLTKYTVLNAKFTFTVNGGSPGARVGIVPDYNLGTSGIDSKWGANALVQSSGTYTKYVDLDEASGYPMVSSYNGLLEVNAIWLE